MGVLGIGRLEMCRGLKREFSALTPGSCPRPAFFLSDLSGRPELWAQTGQQKKRLRKKPHFTIEKIVRALRQPETGR
jgi:hypothetical protein